MKKPTLTYTTVLHQVRAELGLSIIEYFVADMIYHLSANPSSKVQGWCYASKQYLADVLLISKGTVTSAVDQLIEKQLIEKHEGTKHLRTTDKWYKSVIDRSEIDLIGQKLTPDRSEIDLQHRSKIDPNNNNINKDKDNIPDKPEETFDFDAYWKKMVQSNSKLVQIIAVYWDYKDFLYETKEQASSALKRDLRAAKALDSYPKDRIKEVIDWLSDNADFKWTLETVHKYIDEDLSKITKKKQYA